MVMDADCVMLVCPYCDNREPLDAVTASRLNARDHKEASLGQMELQRQAHESKRKVTKGAGTLARRIVIAVVLLFLVAAGSNAIEEAAWDRAQSERLNSPYEWPTTGLAQMIPQPEQENGYIVDASSSSFEVEVLCASENEWLVYVEGLKAEGFVVDAKAEGSNYEAYNKDGYSVTVYYWKHNKPATMEIRVEEPLVAKMIVWPTSGVGATLPVPESRMGRISYDSGESFRVELADTNPETFAAYANACLDAGFSSNYSRRDDWFYGDDSEGNHVSLEYRGFNRMLVSVYARSS